jgi:general secretion pathway protein M
MTMALPPQASRIAAIAILISLMIALYGIVLMPVMEDYRQTRQSIGQSTALLERYHRIARALPSLEAQLAALKQRQGAKDGFFAGNTDTLIAAQLQGRVRSAVESAHGELKSTQVLPTQDDGKLRRVAVRGQVTSSLGSIQHILYELEAASPFLFIDNLNMRVRAVDRRLESSDQEPILDIRFDVYGYMAAVK